MAVTTPFPNSQPSSQTAPSIQTSIEKPLLPFANESKLNGRVASYDRKNAPQTIWQRLKEANQRLNRLPRKDERFVSNRRPLDCLDGLKPSIAVTLFADGYARHDWTTTEEGKKNGVASVPRYPYDRHSKAFLRAIDLGVLPPVEDLPEKCYYYDGCLVAEVDDRRTGTPTVRVLLRPEMSTLYEEVAALTARLDRETAMLVEQKIVNATAPPVRWHSNPILPDGARTSAVYSNTHMFNVARSHKRRRVTNSVAEPPSVTRSAMLLVHAADRYQEMQRHAVVMQQPALHDAKGNISQPADSAQNPAGVLSQAAIANNMDKPAPKKRKLTRPPAQLLEPHLGRGSALWTPSARTPTAAQGGARANERIRAIRMVALDAKTLEQFQQAQAQIQAMGNMDNMERMKIMHQQTMLAKAGKHVVMLELIRKGGKGSHCEVVVYRGGATDKVKDYFRVHPGDVEQGHKFLDQYKAVLQKEGYVCLQVVPQTQAELQARQRIQQQQGGRPGVVTKRTNVGGSGNVQQQQQQQQQQLQQQQQQQQQQRQQQQQQQQVLVAKQKQLELQRQQQLQRQRMQKPQVVQQGMTVQQQQQLLRQHHAQQQQQQQRMFQMQREKGVNGRGVKMGNGSNSGTVLTPAQLQHLQHFRNQQVQQAQRNMLGVNAFATQNGNLGVTQVPLHNQALSAAVMASAALNNNVPRGGVDALTQARLQHLKQQQRDVDAQTRAGKR